ncbi:MAG TPA: hypothetical protein VFI02_00230 [Armatimonadota bacterium]|nr:hypothetical protein [Armatimonadota bacterium]
MKHLRYCSFAALLLSASMIVGCGAGGNQELVKLSLKNLGQLSGPFQYAAWVQAAGTSEIILLDTFNTDLNNSAAFSRFAVNTVLKPGDRVFVTYEPDQTFNQTTPSRTIILDGNIIGDTEIMSFPRMLDFSNSGGFATVTGFSRNQLLTEFTNLPDISDLNMVYQGFAIVGNVFHPLKTFNFNQTPVSDTVTFDLTTAQYVLSIEPVPDFNPNKPYLIQPFFTNGNLQPLIRQQLNRSSFTPDDANFRFPSGVATTH